MSQKAILAGYERIRAQEQADLRYRAQQAYARCPRLEEIARERRQAVLETGEAMRRGEGRAQAREAALSRLNALDTEQAALLQSLGLPPDHLTLHYRCPACRDTGYVEQGGVRRPCACLVRQRMRDAYHTSGVEEGETFAAFDPKVFPNDRQRRQMEKARDLCLTYAEHFPDCQPRDLLLLGMAGLGKTYLINCIANRVLERGHMGVVKVTAYNLIDAILKQIRQGGDPAERFFHCGLLLIDDLGTEPMMHNITLEYLFSILNERQNAGRATVIASNFSAQELQQRYGERVFSRLFDPKACAVLRLSGESLRLNRL